MNLDICRYCGKPIHKPRPDGRCPACGKPEPPAPALNLPDDLWDFLASRRQLEYDPGECENFGRVTLRQLSKLRVIKYPTRPTDDGRVRWLDDDPHKGEEGYYYVPLVDLVSESEQRPAAADGILVWLPEERLFGYWQPDYSALWTWAGVSWSDIVADPLHFLNAEHPADEFKPWPKNYTFGYCGFQCRWAETTAALESGEILPRSGPSASPGWEPCLKTRNCCSISA